MGRAYEVRKASIQKTGAAKAKLYSMYAREIYAAAKKGGVEIAANPNLKRLIERAKKEQVPSDIINRAIDKVTSGIDENFEQMRYELFGPGGSTLIVDCLTDNVNRTISSIKAALNKCKCKMGVSGSVSFQYDNFCIISFKGLSEEETLEALIDQGVDIIDMEIEEDNVVLYGNPQDLFQMKEAISKKLPDVEFDIDEITMLPKEKIDLQKEEQEIFDRLYHFLDDIEDVQHIYHNVNM